MSCISISGRFYPPETLPNVTELDDSFEWMPTMDGTLSGVGGNFVTGLNLSNSTRSVLKTDIPGIVCMLNPQQMLEEWDLSKNQAMLISYFVIFVIGVLGNITAMMVFMVFIITKKKSFQ